jgi:trehalose-phosphatase
MKNLLIQLSKKYHVALVSGRDKTDLMKLVDIPDIFYAGSHGMDIHGPDTSMVLPKIEKYLPVIDIITDDLEKSLYHFPGAILEKKKLSVAVHYRMMQNKLLPELKKLLKKVLTGRLKFIRILKGKKVIEFLPNIQWNKGKAIVWIINVLDLSWNKYRMFYLGDDKTDEDAFRIVRTRGTGILISEKARMSAADFRLHSPNDVEKWLKSFLN